MAYQNIISLSDAEASFLTTMAAKGKDIFTTRDAYDILGEGKATRDTLERLIDKGWLERIEKGKYLIVPLEAGPDRTWTEDAFVIARHLVRPSMVAYWSALNYWNLTEQVPRVTYVQTTARKEITQSLGQACRGCTTLAGELVPTTGLSPRAGRRIGSRPGAGAVRQGACS